MVEGGYQWRLRWITTVTLLRSVGHVLKSVDAKRSTHIKDAINFSWKRWRDDPYQHIIFHEFIKQERDLILKEYKIGNSMVSPLAEEDVPKVSQKVLLGDRVLSQIDLVDEALRWWEEELALIEDNAISLKKGFAI